MTVDTLANQLALEFGEQYSDIDIADQFQRWVKEVYEEIASSSRWFFLNGEDEITIDNDGTRVYSLDTRTAEIRDAYVGSPLSKKLAYFPVERIQARGDSLQDTSSDGPRAWYISGIDETTTAIKIGLWPIWSDSPSDTATLTLQTIKRPKALSESDQIPLPDEYIRLMRDGVRSKVRYNDGRLQDAAASAGKFAQDLQLLNQRFHGPEPGGSNLAIKTGSAAIRQAPAAVEGS